MFERKTTLPSWVSDEVNLQEHKSRIYNVLDIKNYLLRKHKVLLRKDFQYKENTFETAKVLLNVLKTILNTHISYCIGNPVSISGNENVVTVFNKIYKKGNYHNIDYMVTKDLYTYGNAFEYPYLDNNGVIRSKIIANEDSFPVYDEDYNYTHFIEYWQDALTSNSTYIIYYPDRVDTYKNSLLVDSKINLSGLPICYIAMDKSAYNHFGDSMMNDLIPIMDKIEELLSCVNDTTKTLLLSPIGVVTGQRIDESIPKEIVGAVLNLEEGATFNYPSLSLDYNNIKMLLNTYIEELYAVAGVPSIIFGQSNAANLSETSLKLLFSSTQNKASQMVYSLKEGMFKRIEYIRKLIKTQGQVFSDDDFDSLDFTFSPSRPVDNKNLMEELEIQYKMGAISRRTIIDISPHTNDTAMEISRIEEEQAALKDNTTDNTLSSNTDKTNTTINNKSGE